MQTPRLVLAGTHSGSGKSTVSLALMAALARRGLHVQPFKVGPDYIDPSLHRAATGRHSRNLDAWLMPEAALRALFQRHAPCGGGGVSIIEGVMGLFDGLGQGAYASTAHVAALLHAPALLVMNAEGLCLSAAAMASGYAHFRPGQQKNGPDLGNLRVAGLVLNRVSGRKHYELLRGVIEKNTPLRCFGCLPKGAVPPLPSRHLGLVPAGELGELAPYLDALASLAEEHLDIGALLELASAEPLPALAEARLPSSAQRPGRLRIGVARDAAFSFYYQDNLELLEKRGVELVHCSPLEDAALPQALDGLYIGGGFPEIFAARLEANAAFRRCLLEALENGLPAYAECGGMLYLCSSLTPLPEKDAVPVAYAMTGFFPDRAEMSAGLQPFGYVTVTLRRDCLLGPAGRQMRAHEFHYSRLAKEKEPRDPALLVEKADGRSWFGGLMRNNVFAAYPHLHFHGCPEAADAFLDACRAYQRTQHAAGGGA